MPGGKTSCENRDLLLSADIAADEVNNVRFLTAYEHNPGYDLDRNVLNTCAKTILVWMVDFVMSAGRLKAIVCFDCVSTACQR